MGLPEVKFDLNGVEVPFFDISVAAGEPSYVSRSFEESINVSQKVVKNPKATFCVRVNGQSMVDAGIDSGDLLIVDKHREPEHQQIVLAVINGDFTVKRLMRDEEGLCLQAENEDFAPIRITEFMNFKVWGVVTGLIKKLD